MSRFDQDKMWVTKDGRRLAIKEMDPDHRKHVIAYLRRNVQRIALGQMFQFDEMLYGDVSDGVFNWASNRVSELEDPDRWLESTPLMQALLEADRRYEKRLRKSRRKR